MLPCARGIAFGGEVIDLGNPLKVVLPPPNPELPAQIANAAVDGLRGVGGVYDRGSGRTAGFGVAALNPGVSGGPIMLHARRLRSGVADR